MNRRRIIILSIICLVLLAVFGWKGYGWWLEHKLERYKAELAANGEKLTFQDLLAERPKPSHNSADLFREAQPFLYYGPVMTTNEPYAMKGVLPGKARVGWQQPFLVSDWNGPVTNTWDDLAADLDRNRRGIELLSGLIENPEIDFNLNYSQGFNLSLPHLAPMKVAAKVLLATAMVDLHRGKCSAAASNICIAIKLERGLGREPLLISQLVRIAILRMAINAVWEGLQSPNMNDKDLLMLQQMLSAPEMVGPMRYSLEMERVTTGASISHYRERGGVYDMFNWGGTTPPAPTTTGEKLIKKTKQLFSPKEIRKNSNELLWQSALSYEDELINLQQLQLMVECARAMETNAAWRPLLTSAEAAVPTRDDEIGSPLSFGEEEADYSMAALRSLFNFSGGGMVKALKKVEQIEALRSLAVTAIALKRYRLMHGDFPGSLTTLAPQLLTAVPLDPSDGKPLRYRLNPDGSFLLYAIGVNGVDDGGNATNTNNKSTSYDITRGLDWVWPQPATEEEITAWEAEQATHKD